jgi:hypothetical protein
LAYPKVSRGGSHARFPVALRPFDRAQDKLRTGGSLVRYFSDRYLSRGGAMSEAERYDVTQYERPSVTVDVVIFSVVEGEL